MIDVFSWIVLIGLCVMVLIICIFMVSNVKAIFIGAPYVPTPKRVVQSMIHQAHLSADDTVLDLGSGDGRIVISAAPHCRTAIGIEMNPLLALLSRLRAHRSHLANVHIRRENFWNVDLSDIDVLFVYCLDSFMGHLSKKVRAEMRKGSKIVSHGFHFPDWAPAYTDQKVHVYIIE
jgi:precorrin-6B methylase 2